MSRLKYRHEAIERGAYILWERAGRPDGRDLDFWLAAEAIMPYPLPWGADDSPILKELKAKTPYASKDHRVCECSLCQYSRKVHEVVESRDPEALIAVVKELMSASYNIGDDLNYLECIMDGSWPSAVQQLTAALEKAKNHPNRKLEGR